MGGFWTRGDGEAGGKVPFVGFSDLGLGCGCGDGEDGVVIWWCCGVGLVLLLVDLLRGKGIEGGRTYRLMTLLRVAEAGDVLEWEQSEM